MPAGGGEARQLTFGRGPDTVEGLTPDGQDGLFRSSLKSYSIRFEQLYTISPEGGPTHQIPLPMGYQGSYSSDGTHLAYTPLPREFFVVGGAVPPAFWALFRGGPGPRG